MWGLCYVRPVTKWGRKKGIFPQSRPLPTFVRIVHYFVYHLLLFYSVVSFAVLCPFEPAQCQAASFFCALRNPLLEGIDRLRT